MSLNGVFLRLNKKNGLDENICKIGGGGQKGYFEVQILRYLQKLNLRVTLKKVITDYEKSIKETLKWALNSTCLGNFLPFYNKTSKILYYSMVVSHVAPMFAFLPTALGLSVTLTSVTFPAES